MSQQDKQENQTPTTEAVRAEGKPESGYGACSASGCNCQAYTGSGNTCANCGHNYATHW